MTYAHLRCSAKQPGVVNVMVIETLRSTNLRLGDARVEIRTDLKEACSSIAQGARRHMGLETIWAADLGNDDGRDAVEP